MTRTLNSWLRSQFGALDLAALRGQYRQLSAMPAWNLQDAAPPMDGDLRAEFIRRAPDLAPILQNLPHTYDHLTAWLILNPPEERLPHDHPSAEALRGILKFDQPGTQLQVFTRQLILAARGEQTVSFAESRRRWGQDHVSGLVAGGVTSAQRQRLTDSLTEGLKVMPPDRHVRGGEWIIRTLGLRTRAATALWATIRPEGTADDLWPSLQGAWSRRSETMLGELQSRSHPLGLSEMKVPAWTPLSTLHLSSPGELPPTTPQELQFLLNQVRELPVMHGGDPARLDLSRSTPVTPEPSPDPENLGAQLARNLSFLRRAGEHQLRGWLTQLPDMLSGMDALIMEVLGARTTRQSAWSHDAATLARQMRMMRELLPDIEAAPRPLPGPHTDLLTMLRRPQRNRWHWRLPHATSQVHLLHVLLNHDHQELALMAALLTQLPASARTALNRSAGSPQLRLEHEALQLAAQAALIRMEWRVSGLVSLTAHPMHLNIPGNHTLLGPDQPEPSMRLSDVMHWIAQTPGHTANHTHEENPA